MSELCLGCRHRREADTVAEDRLKNARVPAGALAVVLRQRHELEAAVYLEDSVYSQGSGRLDRPPVRHDWCAARLQPSEGKYFFCDWLDEHSCRFFQHSTTVTGCMGCETGEGACVSGAEIADEAALGTRPPSATTRVSAPLMRTPADKDDWSLPLGPAFTLQTVRRPIPGGDGGFRLDYKFEELAAERPAISGKGREQTYMIFGGPGAGKTFYFKYLVERLLRHDRHPGCLLLDPKGVLTPWLRGVLRDIKPGSRPGAPNREEDLTVLEEEGHHPDGRLPDAKAPFNILGDDLAPVELGRLLSEVVLAGAEGVKQDWAVLITDLLASASVVISADNEANKKGPVTAAALLDAILYRKPEPPRADGKRLISCPILPLARKYAHSAGSDGEVTELQIASDRIMEYYSTVEPKQQRFVRQVIERSLGELTSKKWRYLSGEDNERKGGSLYSEIINNHRVVSVAVGQSSPAFQRSMSTLVKSIFQQAVLADLTRRSARDGGDDDKPWCILACDEYAQVITEGASGLVSDSRFFSLSREAGCLSLLALQSVATGRSRFPADMRDRWEGILGNVTVKFFMKLNDIETAEMASALAGSQHSFVPVTSQQQSAQGLVASEGVTVVQHPLVPPWYLTNCMPQGYALVHGTLDGESAPMSAFVKNPKPPDRR